MVICSRAHQAAFGRSKSAWLATFLALPNGIPAHDTFDWVVARIDPEPFRQSFLAWVQAIQRVHLDVMAIDGETHRRSHGHPNGKAALHRPAFTPSPRVSTVCVPTAGACRCVVSALPPGSVEECAAPSPVG
ncbi:MAG: transposase family protein [Roseiflexus sp.]|nr:transposase family protein [Roseiflexus sp.]